jgi:hypothetical protein
MGCRRKQFMAAHSYSVMSKKNRVTSLDFGIWLCIVGGTESVRGFPTEYLQNSMIKDFNLLLFFSLLKYETNY